MGVMNFTGTALKNLFSKPATKGYPAVPAEFTERTRGHVINDIDACIFCGMCMRKCPTGAITVDRNTRTWQINRYDCVQCACCVKNCPKKCLSMGAEYTTPAGEKTPDVLQKILTPEEIAAEEAAKKAQQEKIKAAMEAKAKAEAEAKAKAEAEANAKAETEAN
ncbi:MAG: 4Fe-4S binding protein [Lachnospiraceae bacterium]|nr:4Fe-4S binding protein [Lachnospiraceae bacterium]